MKKVLVLSILMASFLFGEKLVLVPNFNKRDIPKISKKYDIVNLTPGNQLKVMIYDDGSLLKKLGYSFNVLIDYDTVTVKVPPGFHTFNQIVSIFDSLAQTYPNICLLDTIGFSSQGRPILAMKISDNPDMEEFEPEVRLVGVHHGNEQISGEVLVAYAPYLLENYGTDPFVTDMVNNREIWIIPVFNPDGYVNDTRRNGNGVDLNRDYGYMWDGSGGSSEPYSQPETQAMYEFSQLHNFVLSLTFHSGAFYVNYPWNYTPVRCEDNPFIYDVSVRYGDSTGYPVTEGYDWYQTRGDLNDYSYGIDSDIDITIEVWGTGGYNPPASLIDSVAELNRRAINMILVKAGQGVGGFVIDSVTGDTIKEARIYVEGIRWPVYTDRVTGDYIKLLMPGTYTLRVEANGYVTKTIPNVQVFEDSLTHLNVYLTPGGGRYAFKPVEVYVNASNYSRITVDTFLVGNMLGEHDGRFFYLGIGGHVVLDLGQNGIANGYVKIYEGDDGVPNEGYTVYGSNNWKGPWNIIGNGHGTESFNFAGSYRYIKIVDDGDGSTSDPNPGFDLDAVETERPSGPYIAIVNYGFDDTQTGNGNGRPDPGETLNLIFRFSNVGLDTARNAHCVFVPGDSFVTTQPETLVLGNILPGDTITDTVSLVVSQSCPRGHDESLVMHFMGDNLDQSLGINFGVGALTANDPTGPDNYGYYAVENIDTLTPAHMPYAWIDITSTGTPMNLGDDDIATVNLPFNFTYYGHTYSQISICSNGFIAMGVSSSSPYSNHSLPNSDGIVMVAPFWDDLNPSSSGRVYYHTDGHKFIVEWYNVPFYGSSNTNTFEVIFFDPAYYPTSTGDGLILFQYQNLGSTSSVTIGIESPSENDALQYWYNGNGPVTVAGPASQRDVLFTTDLETGVDENHDSHGLLRFAVTPNTIVRNAVITFALPSRAKVDLRIYDVSGKLVKILKSGVFNPGKYTVQWNTRGFNNTPVPSGIYFVRLRVNDKRIVKKLLVLQPNRR